VRTAPKANQRTARVPCQARKGRPHPFHPSAGKPGGDFGASGSRPACLDARLRPGPQRERAKRGDAALGFFFHVRLKGNPTPPTRKTGWPCAPNPALGFHFRIVELGATTILSNQIRSYSDRRGEIDEKIYRLRWHRIRKRIQT
jgi:hypothetical protein